MARTSAKIIVAADSRQVDENYNPLSNNVCKIRKFGSGYIVMNGLVGSDDSEYNFFKIMRETVKETYSLGANMEALAAAIKPALTKEVNKIKTENEDSFRRNMVEQEPLGLCAVGLENDKHIFVVKKFSVVDPAAAEVSLKVETMVCPNGDNDDPKGLYLVGSPEIDQKLIEKYPGLCSRKPLTENLDKIARHYMQNVINAATGMSKVGGPIDILQVSAQGFKWIQRKDNCKDE